MWACGYVYMCMGTCLCMYEFGGQRLNLVFFLNHLHPDLFETGSLTYPRTYSFRAPPVSSCAELGLQTHTSENGVLHRWWASEVNALCWCINLETETSLSDPIIKGFLKAYFYSFLNLFLFSSHTIHPDHSFPPLLPCVPTYSFSCIQSPCFPSK